MHNLLVRQINKYFGKDAKIPEEAKAFVAAVNEAYERSDADRLMLERSLEQTSREMLDANAEIARTVSLLSATLEATTDGILVVDISRKVESFNQRFIELWRIPADLEAQKDDAKLLAYVMGQLSDPDQFMAKVKELYAKPEMESSDVLMFTDGRIFERFSLPQKVGDKIMGRVWRFRDITERKRTEGELKEKMHDLEEFHNLTVGRELKMIELEKEIEKLKNRP